MKVKRRKFEQVSLLDLLTLNSEKRILKDLKKDLQESEPRVVQKTDGVFEIHGLVYSLQPVEGWIEARKLWLHKPKREVEVIAEKAWIKPDTIQFVYKNKYKKAWAFGHYVQISTNRYEMAGFDFVNYEDFLLVEKKLREKLMEAMHKEEDGLRVRRLDAGVGRELV